MEYVRTSNPIYESSFEAKELFNYKTESYYETVEFLTNENAYHFSSEFPKERGEVIYGMSEEEKEKIFKLGGKIKNVNRRKSK